MSPQKNEKVLVDLNIPQGYQIEITTWENDADYYQKQILNGLTESDVWFYQKLLSRFKSVNHSNDGFGNSDEHQVQDEDLEEWVRSVLDDHPHVSESTYQLWSEALDKKEVRDQIMDKLLGHTVDYDYGFIRVFESMSVVYVAEPIVIKKSVLDVTEEFQSESPVKRPRP